MKTRQKSSLRSLCFALKPASYMMAEKSNGTKKKQKQNNFKKLKFQNTPKMNFQSSEKQLHTVLIIPLI